MQVMFCLTSNQSGLPFLFFPYLARGDPRRLIAAERVDEVGALLDCHGPSAVVDVIADAVAVGVDVVVEAVGVGVFAVDEVVAVVVDVVAADLSGARVDVRVVILAITAQLLLFGDEPSRCCILTNAFRRVPVLVSVVVLAEDLFGAGAGIFHEPVPLARIQGFRITVAAREHRDSQEHQAQTGRHLSHDHSNHYSNASVATVLGSTLGASILLKIQ